MAVPRLTRPSTATFAALCPERKARARSAMSVIFAGAAAAASGVGRRRSFEELHASVARYYGAKAARYKATPLGVDWSCRATQELRFAKLLKLCDFGAPVR